MKPIPRSARGWAALGVLLVGAIALLVAVIRLTATPPQRQDTEMTDGRTQQTGTLLSYQLLTRHPTKIGNVRLVIDTDGGVRVQRNDVAPPQGQDWAADLPQEPVTTIHAPDARLYALLDDAHFFAMDERQVNEAATDGTIRTLTWNGDRGPRTVTVDRARSPEFDRIITELARLTAVPGL